MSFEGIPVELNATSKTQKESERKWGQKTNRSQKASPHQCSKANRVLEIVFYCNGKCHFKMHFKQIELSVHLPCKQTVYIDHFMRSLYFFFFFIILE